MKTFLKTILYIILFVGISPKVFSQLSGNYTIGASGEFVTLTDAVNSLTLNGVNGAVTFNIESGTYNEMLYVTQINGASAINTITFQSAANDSTQVIIIYADQTILDLNGGDYLIFRKLTFEVPANGAAVTLRNNATNNQFKSNIFRDQNSDYSCGEDCRYNSAMVYSYSSGNNNNSFTSNLFENGTYGLRFGNMSNINISNNRFVNQKYIALSLDNMNNLIVRGNEVSSPSYSYWRAITVNNSTNFSITKNKIYLAENGSGIFLGSSNGTELNYCNISNNFISVRGMQYDDFGIFLEASGYVNIVNNTVSIGPTSVTDSRAIFISGGNNLNLLNNIFYSSGQGYPLFVEDPYYLNSNYNNYYTTGSFIARWNGLSRATLNDLRGVNSMDQNSLSINPSFISSSNLHISNPGLNGTATPLAYISDDIDGELRNLTTPDMGADEFSLAAIDAGINSLSNNTPFGRGLKNISVYLRNYGVNTIQSVNIYSSINGVVQPVINWTGNLTTDNTALVNLGEFNFPNHTDYVLKCWTSLPNGVADNSTGNDTLTVSLRPSIGGNYTIGGASPDFATITDAINFLQNKNLVNHTVFKIRNGTYNEQMVFYYPIGTSLDATLSFESESGDSSQVIVAYSSDYSFNNYILYLSNTRYFTFNKISFKALNSNFGRVVQITNSSANNTFRNCVFQSSSNNYGDAGAVIYSAGYFDDNYNQFFNNRLIGGYYGMYYFGQNYSNEKGTRIEGNSFENQSNGGIYVGYQDSIIIRNNSISANSSFSAYRAIMCANSKNQLRITENKITIAGSGHGIYFSNSNSNANSQALVANNFISVPYNGIELSNSEFVNVYSNTVKTTSSGGRALNISAYNTIGNINILNNIFVNLGLGGYSYFINQPSLINISNYNDLYSTSQNLGFIANLGDINNLSQLKTLTGKDNYSISIDPKFISATDLHVSEPALNGTATPLADVTTDIDRELRHIQTPDIGADEFTISILHDAGIYSVDNLSKPFSSGSRNIQLTLKNYGANPLQSVSIDWSINNIVQPRFNWTGNLVTGDTAKVIISAFNFAINTNYSVKCWTTQPNAQTDLNRVNDTIFKNNFYAALSGTYTIGGTTPDFTNFTNAVNSLNQGGVSGAVIFKVRPGTYNEQLFIRNFAGSSPVNTVLFESENGDSSSVILNFLSSASANYILRFDSASHVRLNKLTIHALDFTNANVVEFIGNCNEIRISNCVLSNTSKNSILIGSTSTYKRNYHFNNNRFVNGAYGIYFSYGPSKITIENNSFENQGYYGIALYYPDTVSISKNNFASNSTSNYSGISISSFCRILAIEKNQINILNGGTGINLSSINSLSVPGKISNNFIHIGGSSISSGINSYTSYRLDISHNSVNISNTNSSSRALYIFDGYGNYNTQSNLRNNILMNSGGGYALYSYYSKLLNISDYNDLYSTGANLAYWGANFTNLTNLKSSSGKDVHSVSVNPLFVSATDLHVSDASLNNSGIPIAEVTNDIDGELRSTVTPDIGADEFTLTIPIDAGIFTLESLKKPFPAGTNNVKVSLKNYGIDTIKSIAVDWAVNNVPQPRFNWSGSLASGDTTTIAIGSYSFNIKANYSIKSWTLLPNGQTDPIHGNDTLRSNNLFAGLAGTYTIGGANPDFTNFADAVSSLNIGGLSGPTVFKIRQGTYTEQITLPKITGSSRTNTLTFESENGDSTSVVLNYLPNDAENFVLFLNDCQNLTLRNFTIQSLRTQRSYILQTSGSIKYLSLEGCILKSSNELDYLVNKSGGSIDSSSFSGNRFINGQIAIYFMNGLNTIAIGNNNFEQQSNFGIALGYSSGFSIKNNVFTGQNLSTNYTAISVYYTYQPFSIEKNRIYSPNGIGVQLYSGSGNGLKYSIIANNFIHVAGTGNSVGIETNGSYLEICYNSINISNTNSGSSAFLMNGSSNVNLRNNILSNFGGGYSLNNQSGNLNISDYNNLFTTGANLAFWSGNRLSLADLRVAGGKDAHSISVNPLFVSATNLHVSEIALNSAGSPVSGVPDDIDGELRHANFPDIGADEFNNNIHDIGIAKVLPTSGCLLGTNVPITVTVKNYGVYPETGFELVYVFENSDTARQSYNQTINAGESADITFTRKLNMAALKSYNLKVYGTFPIDENKLNDTIDNTVDNMPKYNVTLSNDTAICKYRSVTLSASGATTYVWSNSSTSSSITVNPLVTSRYSVTAINRFNCISTDSVTVLVNNLPAQPVISPAGPINVCSDSIVVLTSNYAQNNIWSTFELTTSISIVKTGYYYVTHTDSLGCSSTSNEVFVSKELAPILAPADTTVCSTNNLTLRVFNATSYLWSTGQTTQTITISPATNTNYSIFAITPLGCSKTLQGTVKVLPSKVPAPVSGMIPAEVADGLSLPIELSWMPAENATHYDLFIWPIDQIKPAKPLESNITGIRYTINPLQLDYGKPYYWQLISKYYGCEATTGSIQSFTLRNLPDLVVTNVQAPKTAFTGQEIEVTLNITNQGLGSTINQPWVDQVSLSLDSAANDDFHSLGMVQNMTFLEPGQSYSKKAVLTLPEYKDGLFTVFTQTDYYNSILESNNNNNSSGSTEGTMVSLAPVPDLYVSDISSPTNFFSEDTVFVAWKVVNKGEWHTKGKSWTDKIYLSQDYNSQKRYSVGSLRHEKDTLKPGSSYTATLAVAIPEGIFGRYYFYVEADGSNEVKEHAYDGNNVSQGDSVNVVLRPPADLQVTEISIPKTTTNIATTSIRWRVTNMGNSSPTDKDWTDVVYLSVLPTFDVSKSYSFPSRRSARPNGIPSGMEYSANSEIEIPKDIIPGDYYVYVKTDAYDNVFEYTFNDNNLRRSDSTLKITIAPYPDLQVTSVNVPDSSGAGEAIPITYSVKNIGTAAAKDGWNDYVSITDAKGVQMGMKMLKRYDILGIDESYLVSTTVNLPSGIDYGSGKYSVTVMANDGNILYEHKHNLNNWLSDTIFIMPSDLSVESIIAPEMVFTGTSAIVTYSVQNNASVYTPARYWNDKIDIVDSENRIVLSNNNFSFISGPVKPGDSYSGTVDIAIPEGFTPGNYYLRVRGDVSNFNAERIRANNSKKIPIRIELRQPSDLTIVSNLPTTGTAGQPISITWTVTNSGTGNTLSTMWNDYAVLSKDTIIDVSDIYLVSYQKSGGLASGLSYSQNKQGFIPITAVGNYYILLKTDYLASYNGNEFEMNAENNNQIISLITVSLAPPSDLTVSNVIAPSTAVTGEPTTIDWTIRNNGPNKASGYLTDMVYLSKDTEWDITDVFFGELKMQIDLSSGDDTTLSLTANLTGASKGNYYVIVRTDNKNNINEVNDYNNLLSSVSPVSVQTLLLPLYTNVTTALKNGKALFYRIEIPDSLVDETLLVTIKGDSVSGANELFISYNSLPDRSDFDFKSHIPSYGNQEIIIPVLQKGDYYLMVYGNVNPGAQQNIVLRAEKINFQVRTADANKGGNRGTLTTLIYGAKFRADMKVKLQNADMEIVADTLILVDATKAFVSFDLMRAPLGVYDIVAINAQADTAILSNGFEVEEGSPFGLVTSVKSPGVMLAGTKTTIAVQFANEGNNDISIPHFKLISENGLPIALKKIDLDKKHTVVNFELREVQGPQHVLRPGAVNSLYIWVHATVGGKCHFRFE